MCNGYTNSIVMTNRVAHENKHQLQPIKLNAHTMRYYYSNLRKVKKFKPSVDLTNVNTKYISDAFGSYDVNGNPGDTKY